MAGASLSSILRFIDMLASKTRISSGSSSEPCTVEDLVKLKEAVVRIQDRLKNTEETRDASVELWMGELKGVAQVAERALGEYESIFLQPRLEQRTPIGITGKRKRELSKLHKILLPDGVAHRIKEIRKRIDEIVNEWDAIHLRKIDGERRIENLGKPLSGFQVEESSVYGREDDKNKVIELLSSDDCRKGDVSVVSIVGIAGVGKTTLAQLVYNDQQICETFTTRGWVCVLQDFDEARLMKAVAESITGKPCHTKELKAIQGKLEEIVTGKRLLLVLDDVENEKESLWACLQVPLMSAEVCKIIITTRNEEVAKIIQRAKPYPLSCLPEETCWLLFQQCAFDGLDLNEHRNLLEIGKKIVMKCRGLPLAAKTLGGLLRFETDEDRWKDILQSDMLEFVG